MGFKELGKSEKMVLEYLDNKLGRTPATGNELRDVLGVKNVPYKMLESMKIIRWIRIEKSRKSRKNLYHITEVGRKRLYLS